MKALEIEREYIAEMRQKIEFLESQMVAKNDVIVALEGKISELSKKIEIHKQYYG